MIPVTKPFLPPQEEYDVYLRSIWKRNWLTNNGPLVNELEIQLKKRLKLNHLLYVGNGTIALQIAIKALELKGQIITTPFSYVATTSSIVWEGCNPIFVDIDENTLNIDPNKIEEAINENTSAILATHCFGNSCKIDQIKEVADKYNLKVIYDAAHCFGTKYKSQNVYNFGDISTASFHATKLYHTIEGGAIISNNPQLIRNMAYMRNFGHSGIDTFAGVGINGKNSEFHAAMGLVNLNYIDQIIERRKLLSSRYDEILKPLNPRKPKIESNCEFNYSYYPIIFESEQMLLKVIEALNKQEIYPRRYFYPVLSNLDYVEKQNTPIAADISKRILCLPLYHNLTFEEIDMIGRVILRIYNYNFKK